MSNLTALLEQHQKLNAAILARLEDPSPDESPMGTRSYGEEMDQNYQLILIRKTQGEEAWRIAHKAVMAERKKKLRHASRRKR